MLGGLLHIFCNFKKIGVILKIKII